MSLKLKPFLRSEDGSYSVEAALIFPLLLWAFAAIFVFWDVFKLRNDALAATYTIADIVSRQPNQVNDPFINGLNDLFTAIVGDDRPNDVRVTVFQMRQGPAPNTTELALLWSEPEGTRFPEITDPTLLEDDIPILAVGATIIMVESEITWFPPVGGLLPQTNVGNRVFASPRFVPQIGFDDGSTDLGPNLPDDGD